MFLTYWMINEIHVSGPKYPPYGGGAIPELEFAALLKETNVGSSVLSNGAAQGVSPAIRFEQAKSAKQRDIMHLITEYSGNNGVEGIS